MIIFENGFIKLDYDPATDVLTFKMPDVDQVVMPEMVRSLGIIVEHVRNYDVKKILLDARKTDIWVDGENYSSIITKFYSDLTTTRLQKVARLITPGSVRENVVEKIFEKIHFPLEVEGFTDPSEAFEWLKGKN